MMNTTHRKEELKTLIFNCDKNISICLIHSFENFPTLPKNTNLEDIFNRFNEDYHITNLSLFLAGNTKIRSLSGLSLYFLHYFLPHYAITDREFDFAPHGKKLLENCIDREYLKQAQTNSRQTQIHDDIEQAQILEDQKRRSFIHENLAKNRFQSPKWAQNAKIKKKKWKKIKFARK